MIYKFEYIWLDGDKPSNIRSKTKILTFDNFYNNIEKLPNWNFDGSSTKQAESNNSEIILKPVRLYKESKNSYLVLCECFDINNNAIVSNTRSLIKNEIDFWWGFEQEYVLLNEYKRPLGFPKTIEPKSQGDYYCGVGYQNIRGREIAEEHLNKCLEIGLGITGINAEVMIGQWEFQCFGKGIKAADDLIIARYLLHRIAEKYKVTCELHPKPIKGEWNGSGLHTNISWNYLREIGGKKYLEFIFKYFKKYQKEHMEVYGCFNNERLTGNHETSLYNKFSYGEGDRTASIRIPNITLQNNYKGYIEDRRPSSNADPYEIIYIIMKTVNEANKYIK